MNESPGALELLSERVAELEKRVCALEHPAEARNLTQSDKQLSELAAGSGPSLETGKLFPIIGRAMLGIAGAYVLRAVAESAVLPKLAVSIFAVLYAFGWLVWSARISNSVARTVYAGTAALILAPMLWENTLVFHVFTPMATAGVLAAFLTLATVMELRDGGVGGMWIAQSTAVLITAALGFTTLHGLPFVTALLIAVFVSEFARAMDFPQPVWPLITLVSDGALWGLMFIYSGPQDTRAAYPHLSAAALIVPATVLFAINGSTVAVRVVNHRCRIMIFELVQVMIAFAIASLTVITFAPLHGATILGIVCLVLSSAAYVCAFRYLAAREERRSFRVFGVWSASLLVAGSIWAFPPQGSAILLAAAAVVATYLARRVEPEMLELHGALFLFIAAVMAGLPAYLYRCMAGMAQAYPKPGIVVVSICSVAALMLTNPSIEGVWRRAVHLVFALMAISALLPLLVQGVVAGAGALMVLDVHHGAFLRTIVICAIALGIAFGGSRWGRLELTHLAYAALVLVGVKLLLEDLRNGHLGFMAASIALFAMTLMGVPRLLRLGAQLHSAAAKEAGSSRTREISV